MKYLVFLLLGFCSYSQNNSSVYGTSKPINFNINDVLYDSPRKTNSINFNNTNVELLIYGGENNSVYLGCINCSKNNSESIWNKNGDFGSTTNKNSVWNKYGDFSGKYSNFSPFNKYASTPPILVDKQGNFYGYFTADSRHNNLTKYNLANYLCENWEDVIDDTQRYYNQFFN